MAVQALPQQVAGLAHQVLLAQVLALVAPLAASGQALACQQVAWLLEQEERPVRSSLERVRVMALALVP